MRPPYLNEEKWVEITENKPRDSGPPDDFWQYRLERREGVCFATRLTNRVVVNTQSQESSEYASDFFQSPIVAVEKTICGNSNDPNWTTRYHTLGQHIEMLRSAKQTFDRARVEPRRKALFKYQALRYKTEGTDARLLLQPRIDLFASFDLPDDFFERRVFPF